MKKKKISFPSALTVLFIVLIFAAILTAVVPAGLYSKLTYNADHDVFEITTPEGEVTEMTPTQESLDELGVTGNLNKFLDGSISKPIAVPGTYERVDQEPQGVFKILLAAISGVYDTIDIILFVFILGGCIGVLNYMGAFNAAIAALSKVTKGKEYILIILITIIIAAGGTTFGLAEETIALYPIRYSLQPDMMLWFVSLQFTWDLLSEPCSRPSTRSLSETHPMQPESALLTVWESVVLLWYSAL